MDYLPLVAGGLGAWYGGNLAPRFVPIKFKNESAWYSALPAVAGAGIGGGLGLLAANIISEKVQNAKDKMQEQLLWKRGSFPLAGTIIGGLGGAGLGAGLGLLGGMRGKQLAFATAAGAPLGSFIGADVQEDIEKQEEFQKLKNAVKEWIATHPEKHIYSSLMQ